jgi:hypothetical protein
MSHARLPRPPALSTFSIGSLPHTQLELAMQQALQFDIPTLPQLPKRNAAEFMLPQAIEGFPGLRFDADGRTQIDRAEWEAKREEFGRRLKAALSGVGLEAFEPSGAFCAAWKPFLWEVEQRKAPFAKAQLTGPITILWATTLTDGAPLAQVPGLEAQLVELILVRALAMVKALQSTGATPILFLDEPGLYAFDKRKPSHLIELRELNVAIASLKNAGALVGVHCCGNTEWEAVLKLGLDFLSVDVRLSLDVLLATSPALEEYLAAGGWLGLGIVPTNVATHEPMSELVDDTYARMGDRRKAILARALLSPACGLAMRTVAECEQIASDVREAQSLLQSVRSV